MKEKIKSLSIFLIVCIIGLATGTNAVVIYQDNFDGASGTDLDGQAPDIAPGSEVWNAGTTINADGEIIFEDEPTSGWPEGYGDTAFLPFTPESGHLYRLSATLDAYEGYDWLGLGFVDTASPNPDTRFYESGNTSYWWCLSRAENHSNNDQTFIGPGTGSGAYESTISADDIEIVLDTRNTPWTVEWFLNGNSERKEDVSSTATDYVAFSDARCSGHISSFLLIDDYSIVGTAWDPDPEPGDENIGSKYNGTVQATLKWKSGLDPVNPNNFDPNINNHLLYLDTNSAKLGDGLGAWSGGPGIAGPGGEVNIPEGGDSDFNASWTFTNLEYGTTYYWRVNESVNHGGPNEADANTLRQGDIWSFKTIGEEPNIITQPVDLLGAQDEIVTFTVGVASASTPDYTWYKSSDTIADEGSPDTVVGTDSNTLAVTANDANDAWYYVVVGNSSPVEVTSDVVHLWLEREIARYRLNGDLTDSSTAAKGGTAIWDASGDPCTAHQTFDPCAIEGPNSARFYDDIDAYILVPDSNDYFDNYIVGLTASAWVKVEPDASGWEAIVAKQARSTSTTGMHGWVLELNSGLPVFQVRNADVYADGPSVADAKWHMVTAVYDIDNNRARVYVDGSLSGEDTSITSSGAVKTPLNPLTIGAEDANDGATVDQVIPFDGLIDDVRIFTYPMTSYEVADLYLEYVTDASICIDNENPDMDLTGDCQVNLADIEELASSWLDCNLYPASTCN